MTDGEFETRMRELAKNDPEGFARYGHTFVKNRERALALRAQAAAAVRPDLMNTRHLRNPDGTNKSDVSPAQYAARKKQQTREQRERDREHRGNPVIKIVVAALILLGVAAALYDNRGARCPEGYHWDVVGTSSGPAADDTYGCVRD